MKPFIVACLMATSLFVSGCKASPAPSPQASVAPAATQPATQPATATPLPAPTATRTPTATVASGPFTPKPGHWEGKPGVAFDVTSDGAIQNFSLVADFGYGQTDQATCTLTVEAIPVVDNRLEFSTNGPISTDDYNFIVSLGGFATPVVIDKNATAVVIQGQHVAGAFDSATSLTGTYLVNLCENRMNFSAGDAPTWGADWVRP